MTYPYRQRTFNSEFMRSLHGISEYVNADHLANITGIKQAVYQRAVEHSPEIEAKMQELVTWEKQYDITKSVPEIIHAASASRHDVDTLVAHYMQAGKVPTIPVSERTPVQWLAGLQANIQLRANALDAMFVNFEKTFFTTAEGQKTQYRIAMADKPEASQLGTAVRPLSDDHLPTLNDVVMEPSVNAAAASTHAASQEANGLIEKIKRHKIKAGVGATAIVASGGWALHEMNKRQSEELATNKKTEMIL